MPVRSLIFNIGFWLWIAVLGLCSLPFCLAYRPLTLKIAKIWAYGSLWFLRITCGITHVVKGQENIPKGAAIIASKHQSAWDTIIFWTLLDNPSYVLKRELLFFPVFGWYLLLLKSIYINRKSGASAIKRMLRDADRCKKEAGQIVIFPEGTRTAPGSNPVYHPGIAALYQHLDLPVVPVALNSGLLWSKNAFTKKPGVITIEFLENITPGMKSRDFLTKLENIIEENCRKL